MFSFLRKHKKILLTLTLTVSGVFLVSVKESNALAWTSVFTDPAQTVIYAVGKLISLYVQTLGALTVSLIGILVRIAQYNNFVNSPAVVEGWVIIRDVVNMFFILILLVIAFATIFNVKEYKYQAMLPRLLAMAVVINFSRTIAGLIIDLGQVVMLTFVNGFQAAAGGNFVNALKINELLKFDPEIDPKKTDLAWVFVSFILAALMITVTVVVIVVMVMTLVFRIIMLWFLVVLSPLAFMASVWPSKRLNANYGKWWDMFLDNVLIGPIMAFFLWLSLLVLGSGTIGKSVISETGGGEVDQMISVSGTTIGKMDNMISYLMGIGMLLGSLYMTKQMQSAGGGIAGVALEKIQHYAKKGVVRITGAPLFKGTEEDAKKAPIRLIGQGLYEETGARAYREAVTSKFRNSKFAQKIGLGTTGYKDTEKAKRTERALRATGQLSKANALRESLEVKEQKSLQEKNLTFVQLEEKLRKTSKGSYEYAAIARELASKGRFAKSGEFEEVAGGDKRLESTLRFNAYKAGIKNAMIGYKEEGVPFDPLDQSKTAYRGIKKSDREDWYKDVENEVKLDDIGKLNNEFITEKLAVVDRGDFEKFSKTSRARILAAMNALEKNAPEQFAKLKIREKIEELSEQGEERTPPRGGNPPGGSRGPVGGFPSPKTPPPAPTPPSGTREVELEEGEKLELDETANRGNRGGGTPPISGAPVVPPSGGTPPTTPSAPSAPKIPPKTPAPVSSGAREIELEGGEEDWNTALKDAGIEVRSEKKERENEGGKRIEELKKRIAEIDKTLESPNLASVEMENLTKEFNSLNKEVADLEKVEEPKGMAEERERIREIRRRIHQKYDKIKQDLSAQLTNLSQEMRKIDVNSEEWKEMKSRQAGIGAEIDSLDSKIAKEEKDSGIS
ncbi:MAG: hypothetical protein WC459_05015 [Patescibacteria group bacterium]